MLRIGEAAKKYDISNRTLRYWEEVGILQSIRMENGYRYYNSENAARIGQIVLLRKLRVPIADIERIFIADDFRIAIDALNSHLASLKQDALLYGALIALVEKLIAFVESSGSPEQIFSFLEAQGTIADLHHKTAPQIQPSERIILMSKEKLNNVRIVNLPAMTVAAYCAVSTTPEDDCSKVFDKFVLENNLHKRDGYRSFGFNNPDPTADDPVYGYEMWITIPEDLNVPAPLAKKQFSGGLFASISAQMNEISERWDALFHWSTQSEKYDGDFSVQWLEELTMDYETFISPQVPAGDKQLDILLPIKLK